MTKEETPTTEGVDETHEENGTEPTAEATNEEAVEEVASEIEEELAAVRQKAQENLDGWQRARAEFANYKKRVERELKDSRQAGAYDVLIEMLPIIDDFERAMSNVPEDIQENPWMDGISLIQRKFAKLLEAHDVDVIDPVGELFDPNRHEAVGMDDTDDIESGHVTTTLQKGYIAGERVLRPALVRVAQ